MKTVILCLSLLLALAGCQKDHNLRQDVPKRILAVGDWHIDTLKNGDMEANKKYLAPSLYKEEAQKRLEALSKVLQSKDLVSQKNYEIIYYSAHGILDGYRYNLTYQIQFKDYWLLVHMSIDSIENWRGVISTSFQPIPRPIQEMNAFSFKHATWLHYLVLAVSLAFIVLLGFALWRWWHITMPTGWKIFWLIIIFLSVGRFIFDWNYNRYAVQWVTVRGAPVWAGTVTQNGWWYFTLSFPAGALVFLYLDRRWRIAEKKQKEDTPSQP